MSSAAPVPSKGASRPSVCIPVVYGTISWWLGKKTDESSSHKWTAYVRGPRGEDMSYFFSKVVYHLHQSFDEPIREVASYPFELSESGWGEFDMMIRLVFRDPSQAPLDIMHHLKLYPTDGSQMAIGQAVVSEFYDEIVIEQPSESMYQLVANAPELPIPSNPLSEHYTALNEEEDLRRIMGAQNFVTAEIERALRDLYALEGSLDQDDPEFPPPVERDPARET